MLCDRQTQPSQYKERQGELEKSFNIKLCCCDVCFTVHDVVNSEAERKNQVVL